MNAHQRGFIRATLVAAWLGAWLLAVPAFAQIPSGTILGVVKDAQGGVVPGASVTATNAGTKVSRTAVTDADGQYQPAAPAGRQLHG